MDNWLTTQQVAEILGVGPDTIRSYRTYSRAGGRYEAHPFPEPDEKIGPSLLWKASREAEIREWASRRPGAGVGGGRPRKAERPTVADRALDDGASAG